jgi:hypothetical protein
LPDQGTDEGQRNQCQNSKEEVAHD